MFDFKFTILTPWTLLSTDLPEELCKDDPAIEFARVLCNRTLVELDRHSFWPRARGEAFIRKSFDSFEERFLQQSEYAVIVLSGKHIPCLDNIYPRFLVFLTRRPSWADRLLLVFLGEPEGTCRFDTTILTHEPIVFHGSMEDGWAGDDESWTKLLGVLRKSYIPQSTENLRSMSQIKNDVKHSQPKWMSVTDVRGRPLAVRISEQSTNNSIVPASWHDLTCGNNDIWTNHSSPYSTNCLCSPLNQSALRVSRSNRRSRSGSYCLWDSATHFDLSYDRSSSVPLVPPGRPERDSPHGSTSNYSKQNISNISPYLRRSVESKSHRKDSENQSAIEEQEEEPNLSVDVERQESVLDECVFDANQSTEHMCLPKATHVFRINKGNTNIVDNLEPNYASEENQSETEQKKFFGKIRSKRRTKSSKAKLTRHDDSGGNLGEGRHVIQRIKGCTHGLWKVHHRGEKFGARTKSALGGTLKSLADFSTGILATDPGLDVKSMDMIEARSCPNIQEARSRPLSPTGVPFNLQEYTRSGNNCSPSTCTYHPCVHALVDDCTNHTSTENIGPIITVQQPIDHYVPISASAQTDLTMAYMSEGTNLSHLSAVRHDSGRGSMSPVLTDVSVETAPRTWMSSTNPNSPNTYRTESRAKSVSDFVPRTSDDWDQPTISKPLIDVPLLIMPISLDPQFLHHPNETVRLKGTEPELCAPLQITLPHEVHVVVENLQSSPVVVDHQKSLDALMATTVYEETSLPRNVASGNVDKFSESTPINPDVVSEQVRVQHHRPDYVYVPETTAIQMTQTQSSRADEPHEKIILNAQTCEQIAGPITGRLELEDQKSETFQQQDVPHAPFEIETSLNSAKTTASKEALDLNSPMDNVQPTFSTKLKACPTKDLTDLEDQRINAEKMTDFMTDVNADSIEELGITCQSKIGMHLDNINLYPDRTASSFAPIQTPEMKESYSSHGEMSLCDVPEVSSLNDLPSGVSSDNYPSYDAMNMIHNIASHHTDDATISMNFSESDADQIERLGHQAADYQNVRDTSELNARIDIMMPKTVEPSFANSGVFALNPVVNVTKPSDMENQEPNCLVDTDLLAAKDGLIESDVVRKLNEQPTNISNRTISQEYLIGQLSAPDESNDQTVSANAYPVKESSIADIQLVQSSSKELKIINQEEDFNSNETSLQPTDVGVIDSKTLTKDDVGKLNSSDSVSNGLSTINKNDIIKDKEPIEMPMNANYLNPNEVKQLDQGDLSDVLPDHSTHELPEVSIMKLERNQPGTFDTPNADENASQTWYNWLSRKLFGRSDSQTPTESTPQSKLGTEVLPGKNDLQQSVPVPELSISEQGDGTTDECEKSLVHNEQAPVNETDEIQIVTAERSSKLGAGIPSIGGSLSLSSLNRRPEEFGYLDDEASKTETNNQSSDLDDVYIKGTFDDGMSNESITDKPCSVTEQNIQKDEDKYIDQKTKQGNFDGSENTTNEINVIQPDNWKVKENSAFGTNMEAVEKHEPESEATINIIPKFTSNEVAEVKNYPHLKRGSHEMQSGCILESSLNTVKTNEPEFASISTNDTPNNTIDKQSDQHGIQGVMISNGATNLTSEIATSLKQLDEGTECSKDPGKESLNYMKSHGSVLLVDTQLNDQLMQDNRVVLYTQPLLIPEIESLDNIQNVARSDIQSISPDFVIKNASAKDTWNDDETVGLKKPPEISGFSPEVSHNHFDSPTEAVEPLYSQLVPMGPRGATRPSQWSFIVVASVFDFVTIYIPRHAYWFYSATFVSREQLFEAMADHGIRLAISWKRIEAGLRNPYCVSIVFLGVTSAAPYLSYWPQLAERLINVIDWYTFTPPFWVDRPILHYLGDIVHSVHRHVAWHGQSVITSFRRYPWALVNPSE